jgi:hypothetical protein
MDNIFYLMRAGQTAPGKTDWKQYSTPSGIYVDVDTSEANFTEGEVVYTASLAGNSNHWATTGGSCIYNPTAKGFRVYVKYEGAVTPATANNLKWHINWVGVQVTRTKG